MGETAGAAAGLAAGAGLGAAMQPWALWLAVVVSGLYHGLNPGMGWPLAVSAAMMERQGVGRGRAFLKALGALAGGHMVAMAAVLLPFSAMVLLIEWHREISIVAGVLIIAVGLFLFIVNRHPRFLARVPPGRLALWSFLAATAHGAGLMLVPIYIGLCGPGQAGQALVAAGQAALPLTVALVHTIAMFAAGGIAALLVWRWFGLTALRKGWFDLDRAWAGSLVVVGGVALAAAV